MINLIPLYYLLFIILNLCSISVYSAPTLLGATVTQYFSNASSNFCWNNFSEKFYLPVAPSNYNTPNALLLQYGMTKLENGSMGTLSLVLYLYCDSNCECKNVSVNPYILYNNYSVYIPFESANKNPYTWKNNINHLATFNCLITSSFTTDISGNGSSIYINLSNPLECIGNNLSMFTLAISFVSSCPVWVDMNIYI
ncbi:uncharacterized protein CMU_038990 [Cryptosporidium muris RN66]|uniref:Uncharacterized protein n=1 Tax=Cryptosporidium muris (strain RN66) TaxID=441375 RepID=B6A9E1_CRYMR|nr:uncharacterized protein CMU_038990 [Cryptosporidium muris RN66]EEA04832.1 hypothetical protein CMU_038990 [Cryptosporidium muris RN66]|eukprot:XP_002139181.1 hypothetical protein [Cryptosporidium muris RN66]